jgi:hypothetical protein
MRERVLEVATFWGEDLFSLDYLAGAPMDMPSPIDPALRVVTRWVEPCERLPLDLSGVRDLAGALAVAVIVHVGMLGLGLWVHTIDPNPEDAPRTLRMLGTLAGNIDPGGSEASVPNGGTPAEKVGTIAPKTPPLVRPSEAMIPIDSAYDFGMLGLLRDVKIGAADPSWGTGGGDLFGDGNMPSPTLGLSGVGEGGGGKGEGISLGSIGTIAHCDDACVGNAMGYGHGSGRLGGSHTVRPIICTFGEMFATNGRLPPEVIKRIVRQNMGRFRACYEDGLARNPSLAGRVEIKFMIDRDGEVASALDSGSTLPDKDVIECIARAYTTLSFPSPNGVVAVTYPLELSRD